MAKFLALISVILLSTAAFVGISYISINNHDASLRNALQAKERDREAVFDATWKTVKQVAQVSEKYSSTFKEVYPALMEGRYGNARGGALLSFIQESNPAFDTALYIKLANVIEAKRAEFTGIQRQLIDLKREHDTLLDTFPGSFLIRNGNKVEIKIISSEKTKEIIQTGEENDIAVF